MSQRATSSLEELEARCEALSRRVVDRPAARSPSRNAPGNRPAALETAIITAAGEYQHHQQSYGADNPASLSPQDIATAVASLEREKYRLEEQLRLVNTHLAAYRIVQQTSSHQPRRPEVVSQSDAAHRSPILAVQAPTSPSSVSQVVTRFTPHVEAVNPLPPLKGSAEGSNSPPRPPSATSQTEHIYEELRQIRKMREEREAARHSQLQAQSGVATGSYRPSTGQRY